MSQFCPQCAELRGYVRVRRPDGRGGYVEALQPCGHGGGIRDQGSGFRKIDELLRSKIGLDVLINPVDLTIARLIEVRQGAAQAVPIREIAAALWPDQAANPRELPNLQRRIKISVEKLRTLAHMPIAAVKGDSPGYFIPITAAERDEMFERHYREGIKHLLLAKLFKPQSDISQRLRGQAELRNEDCRLPIEKPEAR